jgi:hypothetical protein
MSFLFTNKGFACRLEGYPALFGRQDDGQWKQVRALNTVDTYIPPPAPLKGPLLPGEIAEVRIQMTERSNYPNLECPTEPKHPPIYQALRFLLPGDSTALEVDVVIGGGCSLAVSPFGEHHADN